MSLISSSLCTREAPALLPRCALAVRTAHSTSLSDQALFPCFVSCVNLHYLCTSRAASAPSGTSQWIIPIRRSRTGSLHSGQHSAGSSNFCRLPPPAAAPDACSDFLDMPGRSSGPAWCPPGLSGEQNTPGRRKRTRCSSRLRGRMSAHLSAPRGARHAQDRYTTPRFHDTLSRTESLPRGNGLERWAFLLKRNREAPSGGERGGHLFSAQILALQPCRAASDQTKPPDPRVCPF